MTEKVDQELAVRLASLSQLKSLGLKLYDQMQHTTDEMVMKRQKWNEEHSSKFRTIVQEQLQTSSQLEKMKGELQLKYKQEKLRADVLRQEYLILSSGDSRPPASECYVPNPSMPENPVTLEHKTIDEVITWIKTNQEWKTERVWFITLSCAACLTKESTINFLTKINDQWAELSDFGGLFVAEAPELFADARYGIKDELAKLNHFRELIPVAEKYCKSLRLRIKTKIVNYKELPADVMSVFENPFLTTSKYTAEQIASALEVIFTSFIGMYSLAYDLKWVRSMTSILDAFNLSDTTATGICRAWLSCLEVYIDNNDNENLSLCCQKFIDVIDHLEKRQHMWARTTVPCFEPLSRPFKDLHGRISNELLSNLENTQNYEDPGITKFTLNVHTNNILSAMPTGRSMVTPITTAWGGGSKPTFQDLWTVATHVEYLMRYQRAIGDGEVEADLLRSLLIAGFSQTK